MTEQEENAKPPFSVDFWKGEGGEKWVKNIDLLERHLDELNRILIEHCAVRPGENVLDVGCGGGLTSLALAEAAGPSGRVLGVDVSPVILEIARARGRDVANLDFRLADAGAEDLGEGTFDLIASRFGVMFFEQPLAAFTYLRRHLKSGGRMVFLCWRRFEENPWMGVPAAAAFSVLPPAAPPEGEPDPDAPGPFSLGEEGRLRFLLEEAGFTEIHLKPVDADVAMGSLEEAVYLTTQMGPAARALEEAEEVERVATLEAIRGALQEFETPAGVVMPCAAWIVSASG
jgi:SAM-dependent methyltransferase